MSNLDIASHPDVIAATAELELARGDLQEAVYGNEPFIEAEEVLKAAQRCRSAENFRNRTIARLVDRDEGY